MSVIATIGIGYLIGAVLSFIITFFLTKDPSLAMRYAPAECFSYRNNMAIEFPNGHYIFYFWLVIYSFIFLYINLYIII